MVIMGKKFGEIFSDSWKEYKDNWKVYSSMLLLLSIIPSLIVFLIEIFYMRDILFYTFSETGALSLATIFSMRFLLFIIMSIIIAILGVWLQASLIYNSLYKKKLMKVKESLLGGKKYFWKLLGLSLLILLIFFMIFAAVGIIIGIGVIIILALGIANIISILIILLLVLLVIAAIIFAIYLGINWTFSVYVLIGENKRIMDSLRISKGFVKGRWWKTFGYLILFGLILLVVFILIAMISLLINLIINPSGFNPTTMPSIDSNLFIISQFVSYILDFLVALIITPFSVLFLKNLYLSWKSNKK